MNVFTVQQGDFHCWKENLGLVFIVLPNFSPFFVITFYALGDTLQQSAPGKVVAGAVKGPDDNLV